MRLHLPAVSATSWQSARHPGRTCSGTLVLQTLRPLPYLLILCRLLELGLPCHIGQYLGEIGRALLIVFVWALGTQISAWTFALSLQWPVRA